MALKRAAIPRPAAPMSLFASYERDFIAFLADISKKTAAIPDLNGGMSGCGATGENIAANDSIRGDERTAALEADK